MGAQSYLIRYGVMSHVGRFPALPFLDTALKRGQIVVLRTDRGVELGEVLIAVGDKAASAGHALSDPAAQSGVGDSAPAASGNDPRVLRVAGPDDLSLSKHAEESRLGRFSLCQRILREGNWPWEIIDVEPLLDGRSTVIHYLGPHHVDVATLRARFRVECDLDVVLEPVGTDLESDVAGDDGHAEEHGGQGCGSCDCSDGGGCRSTSIAGHATHEHHQAEPAVSGCGSASHSGCSSCGIGQLLAGRKQAPA